ncbi:MAG: TrkA family potassium uptake protein [Bacteroidetes bacterium]|nr:MAG: TrkA family potassium uptake protein [Bacteroidota bacterium]
MSKFGVIGLGQFGTVIAKALSAQGAEVMAIDNNEDHVENIKDDVAHAVTLDATDRKALEGQNVQELDAVVVAIGEDFEALLMTTVQLMEMKVNRIVARASTKQQRMILEKLGITEILSPEEEVGQTFAKMLINPNIKSFLALPDGYEIVEIQTPRKVIGKSIKDIDIRQKYGLNLITIKMKADDGVGEYHLVGVPKPETKLNDGNILIIMGKHEEIEKFVELNS